MKQEMIYGLYLGILVFVWMLVMVFTGWYLNPTLLNFFYLVIAIQVALLIWSFRKTAATKSYGQQVVSGIVISIIGGILIFFGSILITSDITPNNFKDLEAMGREVLKHQEKTQAEIDNIIAQSAPFQTSFMQALFGLIGTLVTGTLTSLVAAIFYRKRN